MPTTLDPLEYLDYLSRARRFIGIAAGSAVAIALIGSMLVSKEYTATASIVIEPPVASDPRVATAVSPIYLESLKTYEQFASSDTLFARACDKFKLLESHGSPFIETFKQKVLRVTKLKETKVLQISVTLNNPKHAQALVQFLAEESVNLSRTIARQIDQEGLQEARKQFESARASLKRQREEAASAPAGNVELTLKSQIESLSELDSRFRARLASARADVAETAGSDAATHKALQARAELLATERASLERDIKAKSSALAEATFRRERIDADLRAAQTAFDSASKRVEDLTSTVGMRGEQLRVIDPGIVPQRPSFPNIPLNCAAALLLACMGTLGWLSVGFGIQKQRTLAAHAAFRVTRGGSR